MSKPSNSPLQTNSVPARFTERNNFTDLYANIPYRYVARNIASLLSRTPLTPNVVSILGPIFAGSSAAFLVSKLPYNKLWGIIFLNLFVLFSCIDGELARIKQQFTPTGNWLNYICERIGYALATLAVTYFAFQETGSQWAWPVGFVSVVVRLLINETGIVIETKAPGGIRLLEEHDHSHWFYRAFSYPAASYIIILTIGILIHRPLLFLFFGCAYGVLFYGAILVFTRNQIYRYARIVGKK